jgi:hypothetical protein
MKYSKKNSSYGYHEGELYPLMGNAHDLMLRAIDDKVVAYRVGIAKALGDDPITALVLSQLLHWSKTDVVVKRQGWFYKTEDEFYQETAVTKDRQRTARKKLQDLGILQIEQKGMPRQNWYRIEYEMLVKVLSPRIGELEPYISKTEIDPSVVGKTDCKQWGKPTASSGENRLHSYTESTHILQSVENDGIADDTFSSDEYIQSMKNHKSPHIRLIGSYFEERNAFFPDKKTAQAEVKRWTKDASFLVRYGNEKVDKAWTVAKRKYPDMWNLSTVRKIIPEV